MGLLSLLVEALLLVFGHQTFLFCSWTSPKRALHKKSKLPLSDVKTDRYSNWAVTITE